MKEHKVKGTKWTVKELAELIIDVAKDMPGHRYEVCQASSPQGALKMTKLERVDYMLAMEPERGELYYLGTKDYQGRDCCAGYTGFKHNALGLAFFRNNMSVFAYAVIDVLKDLKLLLGDRRSLLSDLKKARDYLERIEPLIDKEGEGREEYNDVVGNLTVTVQPTILECPVCGKPSCLERWLDTDEIPYCDHYKRHPKDRECNQWRCPHCKAMNNDTDEETDAERIGVAEPK